MSAQLATPNTGLHSDCTLPDPDSQFGDGTTFEVGVLSLRKLATERERFDKQRAEDRKADADRLERIETDIRAMRDLMFDAFQRARTD